MHVNVEISPARGLDPIGMKMVDERVELKEIDFYSRGW